MLGGCTISTLGCLIILIQVVFEFILLSAICTSFVSRSEQELQNIISDMLADCRNFGMSITGSKTLVMHVGEAL